MSIEPIRPLEPNYGQRMSAPEAVVLCRFAKACCPQQQFDQYTPDAWHELLGDLLFDDCKAALTEVAKRQPFVSPSEIREQVKKLRIARIDAFGMLPEPPPGLEEPAEYYDWRRSMMRRIGDGEFRPGDALPMPEFRAALPAPADPVAIEAARRMLDGLRSRTTP